MQKNQASNNLFKMDKNFSYTGSKTNEISFPLGGIGTGSIGLAGNGRLIDWEIFNRPNKMSHNNFSFFAVKAERKGEVRLAKVLHGDLNPPYTGDGKGKFEGFGFGPRRENLTGMPHFANTVFKGEYPIAEMTFQDQEDPIQVRMTAFNPFIPLNDKDSSLPVAMFQFEAVNTSDEELDVSLVGNLSNPFLKGGVNQYLQPDGLKVMKLASRHFGEDAPEFGDLTLCTDGEDVSYQTYWYRGRWYDNLTVFWKEFARPDGFKDRVYQEPKDLDENRPQDKHRDVCVLSSRRTVAPGETATFRFVIAWNFPNAANFWNPGQEVLEGKKPLPVWKNYYATLFEDSTRSAEYAMKSFDRLYEETLQFKETLMGSTLPDTVLDAVSGNISTLKSPTTLRLEDGTLYGFEGCASHVGSCEGSCTHVWNYDQATPFLFPGLARSMRNMEYKYAMYPNGKMPFRLMMPPERTLTDFAQNAGSDRAAADGQMGGIVKVYREWKVSGDTEWLKAVWPQVKRALEYAWEPTNTDWWDKDADGVMEGVQHHTLDIEFYGPNPFLTGMYHAALLAASRMAEALGDEAGRKYAELYERGRRWVDANLFNGEYFVQRIDLQDDRFPIDPELGEIKYQIGEGCHIDQVLGQWHAHIVGLGYIFDEVKVRSALSAIYKYNFIQCLRDYPNACRVYALNDEKGLLICTWPKDNSPLVPVPYADECMNGFEYQAACHMIYEGMLEEGLAVVQAIRERYDGERRNPWNEFECGSNYARSMASFSLLHALSGFEYDMVEGRIGFSPALQQDDFRCFWSLGSGWGEFSHKEGRITLELKKGTLNLNSFHSKLLGGKKIQSVQAGDQTVSFHASGSRIEFESSVQLSEQAPLQIVMN